MNRLFLLQTNYGIAIISAKNKEHAFEILTKYENGYYNLTFNKTAENLTELTKYPTGIVTYFSN